MDLSLSVMTAEPLELVDEREMDDMFDRRILTLEHVRGKVNAFTDGKNPGTTLSPPLTVTCAEPVDLT